MRTYEPLAPDEAREMVRLLLAAKFKWVLSEYENEIYEPLGEPVLRIPVKNTMGRRRRAVECIWTNFPAGT